MQYFEIFPINAIDGHNQFPTTLWRAERIPCVGEIMSFMVSGESDMSMQVVSVEHYIGGCYVGLRVPANLSDSFRCELEEESTGYHRDMIRQYAREEALDRFLGITDESKPTWL